MKTIRELIAKAYNKLLRKNTDRATGEQKFDGYVKLTSGGLVGRIEQMSSHQWKEGNSGSSKGYLFR